ncbi:MAG: CoA-binding protein [Paludibacteraceae bacterium]|nr:CoA-binding protein [Paludibacteraceae bacterium]MBN2787197.1 CoA-binding protein [Paludibacteraceae bacterium]
MKKTLLIGASEKPDRYAYKAINALVKNGHPVKALGIKPGNVAGVEFDTQKMIYPDIDTVTLYVGPSNQKDYYQYIQQLRPKRVVFNPGTENLELEEILSKQGIEVERACTLVLLATAQY